MSGDGSVCCPTECGQCGGTGCQGFPGGANDCCIGGLNGILMNSDVCSMSEGAPCIIDAGKLIQARWCCVSWDQPFLTRPDTLRASV